MAGVKNELLANVAASMRDSVPVHGEPPGGQPSSLARQHEGRRRLDAACVVKLDRISADPNQPRTEFDAEALARLAESLKTRGQLQPIRVRWDDGAGRYVVVVGERRWRAAKLAGLESLACVVVTGNPSPEEILEDQLIENCLREDLKPIEQARAYRALLSGQGVSVRVLAERLNVGHASIVRALALLELPLEIQGQIEAGKIAPATGYQLSKVSDPEQQVELARDAAHGRLTRDVAEAKSSKSRKGRGPAKGRKATSQVFRGAAGKVTVELRKGAGDDAIISLLSEVMEQAKARSGGTSQSAA